jgi:hypothetical protein
VSSAPADLVSLVVAVTGHRDLVPAEVPQIRRAVREFLLELERAFPDLPLLVVTPIAEGADRLVADVAAEAGVALQFVLPMPRELYREDFDDASRAEFDRLLVQGDAIDLPLLPGQTPARIRASREARDQQYERLGIYLAAHCHILLALWDGEPSTAPGGTAHVVRFHQQNVAEWLSGPLAEWRANGATPSAIDFSEDESDLVFHIACSRASGPPLAKHAAGTGRWLTRDELEGASARMPERYRRVFGDMATFNRDVGRPQHGTPTTPLVDGPYDDVSRYAADIERMHVSADRQADRYQARALWALRASYGLAALAGISFVLYADLTARRGMLAAYLLFVALGAGLYLLERRGRWYRRYVDYRTLSEGLRVQFYWALAGVHMANPVRFGHDSFMRRQDLELGWIRNVMRYAGRRVNAAGSASPARGVAIAEQAWVGDATSGQAGYYRRQANLRRRRSRYTQAIGAASFAVGLGCALVLVIAWQRVQAPWSNVLIALMGVLPYFAAVRQSYAQRVAESALINQYEYMRRLYGNASQLLGRATSLTARQEVLRALGEAALDENALWLLRQREGPRTGSQVFHAT